MPNYRVTFFFESGQSGWTESYYRVTANHQQAMNAARGLFLTRRLGMTGSNVNCQAIRVTDPDPPRDTLLETVNANNPQNPRGDYPGLGVHVRLSAGPQYWREQIFRGPPDSWMVYSEALGLFTYTADWQLNFQQFEIQLVNAGWSLRVFDRVGVPAVKVVDVDREPAASLAIITTDGAHGLVIGQTVALTGIVGRIGVNGQTIRRPTGHYQVITTPTGTTFGVLQSLPSDYVYSHGGTSRAVTYAYPVISRADVREPRTRRPGRAFFVPAGRR